MILADGKVYDSSMQGELLDGLEQKINATRAAGRMLPETVISAVEKLRAKILDGAFEDRIAELTEAGAYGAENLREQIRQVLELLRREHLEYKLRMEFGCAGNGAPDGYLYAENTTEPPLGQKPLRVVIYPLGTLFHIAAGNVDGLPVYSVLEGLLTGNVNILKLPQADRGLSIDILRELIAIEPGLAPYLYVFDTPSEDVAAMKQMADMSDGIVVWGGDAVVQAVRQMAKPGTRLIEWGHKLGFAYISGYEDKKRELGALAEHVVETGQLLCSSCQTIFLDTEDMAEVYAFCEEFLPYLQNAVDRRARVGLASASADDLLETAGNGETTGDGKRGTIVGNVGTRAEIALRRYSDTIENILSGSPRAEKVYYGRACSLTALEDSGLELSYMFGNCLVKRLPRSRIFSQLRRHRGYLQSVGLICDSSDREALAEIFASCGLARVMRAGSQSDSFVGEAHDGEYALRRYVRIVNFEP